MIVWPSPGDWLAVASVTALTAALCVEPQLGEIGVSPESPVLTICVDVSRSMWTKDVGGPRLELAKEITRRVAERQNGHRLELYAFAERPRLICPSTLDREFIADAIGNLSAASAPQGGSNLYSAVGLIANDDQARVLLIASDGGHEAIAAPSSTLGSNQLRTICLGIGDAKAATPIPLDSAGGVLRQDQETVRTQLEETNLRALAAATYGVYLAADFQQIPKCVDQLTATIAQMDGELAPLGSVMSRPNGRNLLIAIAFATGALALRRQILGGWKLSVGLQKFVFAWCSIGFALGVVRAGDDKSALLKYQFARQLSFEGKHAEAAATFASLAAAPEIGALARFGQANAQVQMAAAIGARIRLPMLQAIEIYRDLLDHPLDERLTRESVAHNLELAKRLLLEMPQERSPADDVPLDVKTRQTDPPAASTSIQPDPHDRSDSSANPKTGTPDDRGAVQTPKSGFEFIDPGKYDSKSAQAKLQSALERIDRENARRLRPQPKIRFGERGDY